MLNLITNLHSMRHLKNNAIMQFYPKREENQVVMEPETCLAVPVQNGGSLGRLRPLGSVPEEEGRAPAKEKRCW